MNDGNDKGSTELTETDMVDAVASVTEIAGLYSDGVKVLASEVPGLVDAAFETVGNSPQSVWQDYCNALWSVLADSQDKVNAAADNLVDYTNEMFDVDDKTGEQILKEAGDLEGANHPKGD